MEMSNISKVEMNKIDASFQGHGSQEIVKKEVAPKVAEPAPKKENFDGAAAAFEPSDKSASMPSLKSAVEKINSTTNSCEAVFGIHEGTNRVTIKMVDKKTQEVIKEFPAEETLDLIARAWELAGIMVDERR